MNLARTKSNKLRLIVDQLLIKLTNLRTVVNFSSEDAEELLYLLKFEFRFLLECHR